MATEARKDFSDRAEAARAEEAARGDSAEELKSGIEAPKLKRNHLPKPRDKIAAELLEGDGHNSGSRRRGRLQLSQLSAKTRLQIVEMTQKKQLTQAEIADRFNVSTIIVRKLVLGVKKTSSSIVKRYAAELKRSQIQVAIVAVVRRLIDERKSVWSTKQVQQLVKTEFNMTVSAYYVLDVLKKKFRLSYRKIRRVPFSGNSERNLVLRSLYA